MHQSKIMLLGSITLGCFGCATVYPTMEEVHHLSFNKEVENPKPIGPIEGSDCSWSIVGYQIGTPPTLSRAATNAMRGKSASLTDMVTGDQISKQDMRLAYMTDVRMENSGFSALGTGKRCIVVKGRGYL